MQGNKSAGTYFFSNGTHLILSSALVRLGWIQSCSKTSLKDLHDFFENMSHYQTDLKNWKMSLWQRKISVSQIAAYRI